MLRSCRLVCDEMTAMLDASRTAASMTAAPVAVVENYRREHGAGLLAVGHDQIPLNLRRHRTVRWSHIAPA